jgi:hypothetical protein
MCQEKKIWDRYPPTVVLPSNGMVILSPMEVMFPPAAPVILSPVEVIFWANACVDTAMLNAATIAIATNKIFVFIVMAALKLYYLRIH